MPLGPIHRPAPGPVTEGPPPDLTIPEEYATLKSLVAASEVDRARSGLTLAEEASQLQSMLPSVRVREILPPPPAPVPSATDTSSAISPVRLTRDSSGAEIYTTMPASDEVRKTFAERGIIKGSQGSCRISAAVVVQRFIAYGIFPLHFTVGGGHDEELYRCVQKEAECVGQAKLVVWLKRRLWERAIVAWNGSIPIARETTYIGQPTVFRLPTTTCRLDGSEDLTWTTVTLWNETEKDREVRVNVGWCTERG